MPQLTEVDYDPFAQAAPQARAPRLTEVDHDPFAEPSRRQVSQPTYDAMGNPTGGNEMVAVRDMPPSRLRDQMDDITKGIGGGLVRGAAGTVGMVTDTLPNALVATSDWITKKLPGVDTAEAERLSAERNKKFEESALGRVLSTRGIQSGIETVTGPAYEPTTRAGKFASRAAEFVPGSMVGSSAANLGRNALAFGVVPGLTSEAAGQAFEGSDLETPARIVGGLAGGIGGAAALRSAPSGNAIRGAVEGATPQQIDAAEQLFQRAMQAGQPISRAEALQSVTRGSTGLGDLQHTVEGMGGMKQFYSQRPAQNEAAARRAFDTIEQPNLDPSRIGPAVGEAGEQIVQRVRDAINTATRPMYDAAGQNLVPQQVHAAMVADPLFAETLNTIRRDPARNALIRGQSDRSVNVYDAVAKEFGERSRNAAQPLNPNASQTIASVTGSMGSDVKDIAVAADRAAVNGPSAYEAALATQTRLRQQYLQPLLDGYIGKIAGKDMTTKNAIEALFPANPLPNSQQEIAQAVGALAQRSPRVTRDLIRAHAEGVFNEATQRLSQGGFNQSGGAKFAAVLRGNPQQAANLEASVVAGVPNGREVWNGFNSFLENLEAQQFRQATGSRTAFKIPGVEDLKSGGLANNAAQVMASGGLKLPQKLSNAIANWNVGHNLDDIARLLTDPAAGAEFRRFATAPAGSSKALALTARLAAIAIKSRPAESTLPRVVITRDRDGN